MDGTDQQEQVTEEDTDRGPPCADSRDGTRDHKQSLVRRMNYLTKCLARMEGLRNTQDFWFEF